MGIVISISISNGETFQQEFLTLPVAGSRQKEETTLIRFTLLTDEV